VSADTERRKVVATTAKASAIKHKLSTDIYETATRPLYEIAREIRATWKNVYFGAVPYLDAMRGLETINDTYGMEDADGIVRYFLSNARGWRGPDARRIKAELTAMLS
jgi:hypothetical protein